MNPPCVGRLSAACGTAGSLLGTRLQGVNPQRTCIACRARCDQADLVRLVRVGDLIVDGTSPRLPGRGAYLHAGCFDLAERRGAFRRAFGPAARLGATRPVGDP